MNTVMYTLITLNIFIDSGLTTGSHRILLHSYFPPGNDHISPPKVYLKMIILFPFGGIWTRSDRRVYLISYGIYLLLPAPRHLTAGHADWLPPESGR